MLQPLLALANEATPPAASTLAYNAKGQHTGIVYGNTTIPKLTCDAAALRNGRAQL